MRPYRNISDEELASLGAVREWDADSAKRLHPDSELLWVHQLHQKAAEASRRVRRVKVLEVDDSAIMTNFGRYSLETGRNVNADSSCSGRLYLPQE